MYLPYIKNIYGDRAFLMSYEAMCQAIPQSELFLVTQDGEDICGDILVYEGSDQVRGWSWSVKDGDRHWVKLGAFAACEYLRTMYLYDKGFTRLKMGASRPFLNDGVLCFKKKRGMSIAERTPYWFMLGPLRNDDAVRGFFYHNPFIHEDHEGLKAAAFLDENTLSDEDAAALFKRLYIKGLPGLDLFRFRAEGAQEIAVEACGRLDDTGSLHSF